MNTKPPASQIESNTQFDPATSLSNSRLRAAFRDERDFLTPLLSAFLVVCTLSALAICSWSVDGWQNAKTNDVPPTMAAQCSAHGAQPVL